MKKYKYLEDLGIRYSPLITSEDEDKKERKKHKKESKKLGMDVHFTYSIKYSSIFLLYSLIRSQRESLSKGILNYEELLCKKDIEIDGETKPLKDWLNFVEKTFEQYLIAHDEFILLDDMKGSEKYGQLLDDVEKAFEVFGKIRLDLFY